jgi:hypothetical protein
MAPTPRPWFRLARHPSWNPAAEFVNTSSSIVGRLDLGPQPPARLRPAKRAREFNQDKAAVDEADARLKATQASLQVYEITTGAIFKPL